MVCFLIKLTQLSAILLDRYVWYVLAFAQLLQSSCCKLLLTGSLISTSKSMFGFITKFGFQSMTQQCHSGNSLEALEKQLFTS